VAAVACSVVVAISSAAQTTDPKELFQKAMSAQRQGDYGNAIQEYRQLVQLEPKLVPAWMNLGIALVQIGQFSEAIDSYRSALALEPENKQIQFYLALAYFKKGDSANATRLFGDLLAANSKDLRVATLLGASYLQTGDGKHAVAVLEPFVPEAGENPDFLWAWGTALIAAGRLSDGVAAVEKVAKQSSAAPAWLLAGQNLLTLNSFVRARDDLEAAARIDPALPAVQTTLAQAREKNGDYAGAIEAFKIATTQNPSDFEAWLGLGGDQYFIRDLDGAKVSLQHALVLDPASAPALYALGLVQKAQSQLADAVVNLEKAVKIRPDWMEAHVQLAALYFQLHRPADGARERQIVDSISAQQQKAGPGKY
jgi:Flp pilus assembly protein TadD